ncbi:MAG: PAS domain S-box protein, partial [Syntrophales bacterium]|nr:PAS domain S-box protein [Syntrophales bacterium]
MMKADHLLRILFVEDLPSDAELAERELRKEGLLFTAMRVETENGFLKALKDFHPDLIISDYAMPEFDGMQALKLSLEYDANLPFILLTGSMNEETAVACMKAGAIDYIIKEHIKRLPTAVASALEQRRVRLAKKETERALQENEKQYRELFESIIDVFYRTDNEGAILIVSPSIEKLLGYTPDEVIGRKTSELYIYPEARHHFVSTVREKGVVKGVEAVLRAKDGAEVWVSTHAHFYQDKQGKVLGVQGVTRDITNRKQAEEKLRQTMERLREAVSTTIQVIVSTVEARDPYTANHQLRSADLARAIATEMALSLDRIEGIRIAGSIHDLGKLSIPAEILSKPTRLTENEFALIKEHSRKGCDILKNVESPWPLAEIVYQHHKRMDGSGYPRNLKGDEILMEALILAVCD